MPDCIGMNYKINQSMMFSSSPLEKNCINSDSCSPGRNNAPNRFSVGISPMGDENQQIRIQLAVHKYNGTSSSPFNSRCSFISPVRHSLLKNSLKARNYEGDTEGTSKTDKKNVNQYEGVGAFPTIHLKKNAVRYRPIKRFHDVKIPYPELPANRFLSHLPEVCPDLKSSTRSVLDVLEDLSGNKIHSKDENGSNKLKPRGLGGDYLLNPNSVYKPLFVQKPKLNTVLTRDNTTQTLSPVTVETQNLPSSSSQIRNGAPDPKAELRRKLAKQNNEIFASLSSSISSAFSLKRKIDKVLLKDGSQLNDKFAQKRTKMSEQFSRECNENGFSNSIVSPKITSSESVKPSRKSKPSETTSVSPNKDRLTTIFLDTRNTSPKAQLFQENASTETKSKSVEKTSQKTSNGLADSRSDDKTASPSTVSAGGEKGKDESDQSASEKTASNGSAGQEEKGQSDKAVVNFLVTRGDTSFKDTVTSSTPIVQLGTGYASNFNSQKSPNTSQTVETCKSSPNEAKSEKKGNENKDLSKPFTFGTASNAPTLGSFKFGVDGGIPFGQGKPISGSFSEAVSVGGSVATSAAPQFSFGTSSNLPMPASNFQFGAQNTSTAITKTTFTIGQSTSSTQDLKSTPNEGKNETSTSTTTSVTTTSPSIQPAMFTFGQKPNASSVTSESIVSPVSQSTNTINFAASLNKKPTPNSGSLFSFGQKSETSATSATSVQEQTKTFPFSFGQKPNADQSKTQVESESKSTSSCSEPKPVAQESSQGTSSSTSTSVASSSQPPATVASQTTLTQNSLLQSPSIFGSKFGGSSLGSVPTTGFNAPTSAFPNKTLSFGSSVDGFGKTTTQTTTSFATSTSTTATFSFGTSTTTQTIPSFGNPPTTQTPPTFGSSSTTQSPFASSSVVPSASSFGPSASQSTPSFPTSSTTQPQPTFGVSSTPQSTPAFGSSSHKQSTPSFGTTSTTHSTPTFGSSSQLTPSFGSTSTSQPTTFGHSSAQSTTPFGAASTSTQSPIRFGAPTTQNNITFGPNPAFNTPPSTQSSIAFGAPPATSTPGFPSSQSFDNKPIASQTPSIFPQNPTSTFSSTTTFSSNQNNIFAQKPTSDTPVFGENKIQTSGFGSLSQPFASQNKFSFGMSTSNATTFTTSPPITTAPSVFSFGGTTTGNAPFTFGSNPSTSNTQTPFAFKTTTNEPFKFGATATTAPATTTASTTTTKDPNTFGATAPPTFNFGSQINNNPEQKPPFTFGTSQPPSSASGFNFGTPSPSLFNFGGSTSSASSGSSFNFGTPTPAAPFGQTPSPAAPFAVPGTFNIGSGSTQSRPRASSRPRRRQ